MFAWRLGLDVEIVSLNENAIHVLIYSDLPNTPWLLSGIYGPTEWSKKWQFWQFLNSTAAAFAGPWLCLGDFNCILNSSEKRGGRPLASTSNNLLLHLMDSCGLIDLGFKGQKFTWSNNQDGATNICKRLDRAIANVGWQTLFPQSRITHLVRSSSDHVPLLLETDGDAFSHPKLFWFESMWIRDLL